LERYFNTQHSIGMKVIVATASRNATQAIGLLIAAQGDLEMVGEALDLTEMLVLVKATQSDVILLDWDSFGRRIDELQQLLELFDRPPRIVAMSVNDELRSVALNSGVTRFAHLGSPPDHLLQEIRRIEPVCLSPIPSNDPTIPS
jgi:DNA-binding NarL/FixJ family response regulator